MSVEDSLVRAWRARDRAFALGPHFTLGEMVESWRADAERIDNWPAAIGPVLALRGLVGAVLEPVRGKFGTTQVTSAFRCVPLNELVGGAPDSQHLTGEAADIVCPAIDVLGLAQWILRVLPFDQLILEPARAGRDQSPWVHVSWSESFDQRRRAVFTRQPDGYYARGLLAEFLSSGAGA